MKKIHINNSQQNKLMEAKIIDFNTQEPIPQGNDLTDDDISLYTEIPNKEEVLNTLEQLIDKVMESATEVRDYILEYSDELDEDGNEYLRSIDKKMNYILTDLF